jgi:hypothetical protein
LGIPTKVFSFGWFIASCQHAIGPCNFIDPTMMKGEFHHESLCLVFKIAISTVL